jgi:hypothetical protein
MLYQNPDLYDALLPVSENQLNFYLTFAQRYPGGILELGCGSGQLIVPIAARSTELGSKSLPKTHVSDASWTSHPSWKIGSAWEHHE